MARRQRLHMCFILASAYGAMGAFGEALNWTDDALLLACRLNDTAAQLELLALHASIDRSLVQFEALISDRRDCLRLFDRRREQLGRDDPAAPLHMPPRLETYAYFTAQPSLAMRTVPPACTMAASVPDCTFDTSLAEWMLGHLCHSNQQLGCAPPHEQGFHPDYPREASKDHLEFFVSEVAICWSDHPCSVTLGKDPTSVDVHFMQEEGGSAMTKAHEPASTVAIVDDYCSHYRAVFPNVRQFEQFAHLELGLVAPDQTQVAATSGPSDESKPTSPSSLLSERRLVGGGTARRAA